jgi:SAM-dependent methyltransferase
MSCGNLKLNLGCGVDHREGFLGIDKMDFPNLYCLRDIEKEGLPFCDNSCEYILANSFFEHIDNLIFVLNECWRVLKPDGILEGIIPLAGTDGSFRDPTHRRFFTENTFDFFFAGRENFLPWEKIELSRPHNNGHIYFKMKPLHKYSYDRRTPT